MGDTTPEDARGEEIAELAPDVTAHLRDRAVWEPVPAELEGRVLSALRDARDTDVVRRLPEDPAAAPDQSGEDHELSRRRDPGERRNKILFAVAASVVAAAVVVTGGLWLKASGPAPVQVALRPTALAEGAGGQATVAERASGFKIDLNIIGLPPAPRGFFYQGWVKGPAGAVPIGTFHGRKGTGDVTLWSGVDVADYPLLTVTLQREGAGPESSGKVLLSGHID